MMSFLYTIGDYAFGIILIYLMIIRILGGFDFYNFIPFPIISVAVLSISFVLVYCISKMFGKEYSRWLGLI